MDYGAELLKAVKDGNTAFEAFKTRIEGRLDVMEAKGRRPAFGGDPIGRKSAIARAAYGLDGNDEEVKGFGGFLRRGETKAMSIGSGPDGGYAVPKVIDGYIAERMVDISPIRQIARVIQVSTPDFHLLLNRRGTSSGWVGETAARPSTNTPTLDDNAPPMGEIYANVPVSQTAIDDMLFNVEQFVADQVATEFDRNEGAAFISGTGVVQPFGFLSGPAPVTTADATRDHGTLQYVPTGNAGNWAVSNPADALITLVFKLKKAHRKGAVFVMNKATLATITAFKDSGGRYVFSPMTAPDVPPMILGYPVIEAEDMPDIASNSFSIAFGNFRNGYLIVDRIGTRMLRDPFSSKPNVQFYATRRVGGSLLDREAIKLLKFSAS